MQEVRPDEPDLAQAIQDLDLDVPVAFELRHEIGLRDLVEIDLAGLECGNRRLAVGHVDEHDAVELDDLAARNAIGCFRARHIVRIAVVDVLRARARLGEVERERTRTDDRLDLLHRIGFGFLLAHHEADRRRRLREHVEHEAVTLLELDRESLRVLRFDPLDALHHVLAAAIACRPALDRRDDVCRRHVGAVVPLEAVAKLERPGHVAGVIAVLADHLWLGFAFFVDAEERVVDHAAVIGGHVRGRPDRVVGRNVAVEDGADRARRRRSRLGARERGRSGDSRRCGRGLQDRTT